MPGAAAVMAAIQSGDLDQLRALITRNASLASARDEQGVSALMQARYRSRMDMIEILLAAHPALDIFEACGLGDAARAKELLHRNPALANATSGDGFSPLHLAAFFGHAGIAQMLLEHGAEVAAVTQNPMKVTPLNSAAANRQTAVVKLLLDHGAPVDAMHGGFTPLHSAAHNGVTEMVELLLKYGADIHCKSGDGRNPAELARERGFNDLAKRLES